MKTRTTTIVWGAILIGFAALFLIGTFVDLSGFSGGVIAAVVIASIGGLLVVGGSVAAVVRAGWRRDTDPEIREAG